MAEAYQLTPEAHTHLGDLVRSAAQAMSAPIEGTERIIADLYAGRDAGANHFIRDGLSSAYVAVNPTKAVNIGGWTPPETSVNILLSRLQQITAGIFPSKTTFSTKPRLPGAARLSEVQNTISQFVTDHGNLTAVMRRAGFAGMMAPYFGVKFVPDPDAPLYKRVTYEAVEARNCGYEPFQRRFMWHTYGRQWGDLPQSWRTQFRKRVGEVAPNDWDIFRVTEVYHDGFRFGSPRAKESGCPMSVFIKPDRDENWRRTEAEDHDTGTGFAPGLYVQSENLIACPLVIRSFNQPAPNEDVAPAEVVNWIPQIRKIMQTLVQINREVRNLNTIYLYRRGAFDDKLIDQLATQGIPSETLFLGCDADDSENGVNATMRPVEQADNLNSLLAVLSNDIALFDDMIGLSPMERGIAQNPRKSATEAQSITAASTRRNRARLEVVADALSELFQIQFEYQRDLFGSTITIPVGELEVRLDVPDPTTAQFAFEVDPVELGHLSKQGDADALFNGLTVISNTLAMFQGSLPKAVREMLRRVLHAQGVPDADALIDRPVLDSTPNDRYQEYLLHGTPIPVAATDEHQAFIAYYTEQMGKKGVLMTKAADELDRAIAEHNVYLRREAASRINPQAQMNPIEGVSELGVDNNISAAIQAGEPMPYPQQQGF